MAFTIISRTGWGAKPPKRTTAWDVSKLEGVCLHWFGSPTAADTHDGCDDLLRSVQRFHMAPGGLGVPTGGSDIAYNMGVCPHGVGYALRGWNVQTGANGTADFNRRFFAIVYMAGVGDGLTDAGRTGLISMFQEAFKRGVGVKAVGHGQLPGNTTECPGPQLRNFLASGVWRPAPPVQKFKFIMTNAEGKQIGTASQPFVPGPDEVERYKVWHTARAHLAVKGMRADGDIAIKRVKA